MSKSSGSWNAVVVWSASIFLGFVAFAFTQSIFNLFFVPIIVGVLWDNTNKANMVEELEERLSQIEARLSAGPSGATQEPPHPANSS